MAMFHKRRYYVRHACLVTSLHTSGLCVLHLVYSLACGLGECPSGSSQMPRLCESQSSTHEVQIRK